MPTAVNAPAAGVTAPASKLTTERAKPPVTGKPPVKAAATLEAPRPINSWSGTIRCRRLAASVWATEIDSTKPTTLISTADVISSLHSFGSKFGSLSGGKPWGTTPTIESPDLSRPKHQVTSVVAATAKTGPALTAILALLGFQPRSIRKAFIPVRTQNKKDNAEQPMTTAQI